MIVWGLSISDVILCKIRFHLSEVQKSLIPRCFLEGYSHSLGPTLCLLPPSLHQLAHIANKAHIKVTIKSNCDNILVLIDLRKPPLVDDWLQDR